VKGDDDCRRVGLPPDKAYHPSHRLLVGEARTDEFFDISDGQHIAVQ
jgi:hypothetical protein